jgi:hypothetical protein
MLHKRLVRAALSGLIGAAAAFTFMATPVSAGPIGVDAGCKFVLSKVTANRLQEASADEIFLRIGKEYTKTVKFREGETHLASEFGSAALTTEFIDAGGFTGLSVYESDWPSEDEHLGTLAVFCNPGHYTVGVTGFGSSYEIVFDVVTA